MGGNHPPWPGGSYFQVAEFGERQPVVEEASSQGVEGPYTAHTVLDQMTSGAETFTLPPHGQQSQGFLFIQGVNFWFVLFVFAVCSVSILNNKPVRPQMALLPTDPKSP